MRYLHSITAREKFVASGEYTCYRIFDAKPEDHDGFIPIKPSQPQDILAGWWSGFYPSGVKELWTVHRHLNGSLTIRSDRRTHISDNGMHVLGTLYLAADGQPKTLHMRVYVGVSNLELFARAKYSFSPDSVSIIRQTRVYGRIYTRGEDPKKKQVIEETMPLPPGYMVSFDRMTIGLEQIVRRALTQVDSLQSADQRPEMETEDYFDASPSDRTGIPVFYPQNEGGHELHYNPSHLLKGCLAFYAVTPRRRVQFQMGQQQLPATAYTLHMRHEWGGIGYEMIYGDNGFVLQNGMGYIFRMTQLTQSDYG